MTPGTIVIVGAPRSGTTWLQQMLGSLPEIVTFQETDLVDHYLAPWWKTWQSQLPEHADAWREQRHKGLPALLREADFVALLDEVMSQVHRSALDLKPGARVVLEKVPSYGLHGELLLRLRPNALFIHIVRDGRDVVASLLRASTGWGKSWAPAEPAQAARQWQTMVTGARGIAELTNNYAEIRYEALQGERGPDELARVVSTSGIAVNREECAGLLDRFAMGSAASSFVWGGEVAARLSHPPEEPAGFAGEGGAGAWTRELDARARLSVDREAGELLRELGYADSSAWVGTSRTRRVSATWQLRTEAFRDSARYRLAHWIRG